MISLLLRCLFLPLELVEAKALDYGDLPIVAIRV